eukprot:UN09192
MYERVKWEESWESRKLRDLRWDELSVTKVHNIKDFVGYYPDLKCRWCSGRESLRHPYPCGSGIHNSGHYSEAGWWD